MLTLAFNEYGDIVHIDKAEKGVIYRCPDCGADVIRVHGDYIAHHFRHKNADDCGSGGESVVHRYYKQYIANLKEVEYMGRTMQVTYSEVEKRLTDGLVADVILILDNWKSIAVEICYKHAKDEEHIEQYKQLHLECYEVTVDMNDEQTDFEITGWKCLSGYECYKSEVNELERQVEVSVQGCKTLEKEIKKMDEMIYTLQKQNATQMAEVEELKFKMAKENAKRKGKASQEVEETIKEVTGFTYRELQSCFYNNKTGNKYYLLEMMMILEERISDKVKIIQFNWVRPRGTDDKVFTITFLDWKKNHVADSIYNVRCSMYNFNLLAKLITEIYGVKVYKNENGKY